MVLLSGDGKGWVNPLEKGKPEWREQCDEWAGGWKKQRWLEPREVSAPHCPQGSGGAQSIMLPAQAGIPALENEQRLGMQWPNLAGQRWMRLQRQGEVCSSGQRGAARGRVGPRLPATPALCAPPSQHCRDPIPLPKG